MYTNKEKQLITQAWNQLKYYADLSPFGTSRKLDDAAKFDKRERKDTLYTSKALIIRLVNTHLTCQPITVNELASTAQGLVLGYLQAIKALQAVQLHTKENYLALTRILQAASQAHIDATKRLVANTANNTSTQTPL